MGNVWLKQTGGAAQEPLVAQSTQCTEVVENRGLILSLLTLESLMINKAELTRQSPVVAKEMPGLQNRVFCCVLQWVHLSILIGRTCVNLVLTPLEEHNEKLNLLFCTFFGTLFLRT